MYGDIGEVYHLPEVQIELRVLLWPIFQCLAMSSVVSLRYQLKYDK